MTDDQLLVRQCQQGNREAMRRIYEMCKDDLLTLARALLHELAAAEDVVHDVFVAFAASLPEFQLTGSLKGYLAKCVCNRARDRLRVDQGRAEKLTLYHPPAVELPGPDQVLIQAEQRDQVREALAQLPYEQREVLMLYFKGELTFKEIAHLQEVSINTVQGRYRYGLDKLRHLLEGSLMV